MRRRPQRASVVLVALSCVTVLGIAMVGLLALSNQAMKLSNRGYAKAVSKQLAEMGLELALRAFNGNSFSGWTLTNATTAARTLTIDSRRYGNSGITATVNIRVDHYLDTRKATVWDVLTNYAANDFVWYQGVWYLCTTAPPAKQNPLNPTYWKSAPESWTPYANYRVGNIALAGGTAYRCTAANVNQSPPDAAFWTAYSTAAWNATTAYSVDDVAFSGGLPYRCISAHTAQAPPNTAYWLSAPVIYAEGVAMLPDTTIIKTQLRATLAPAPLFPNAAGATNYANLASGGTAWKVDSYSSVSDAYGGSNVGSSAVVAGGKTAGTAVSIGNTRVRGYVAAPPAATAPYAPLWNYGTSGIVTTTPAPTIPATKIDLTRVSRSPYIPQFDIQNVSGAGVLPNGTTVLADGATVLGTAGAASPSIYNIIGTSDAGNVYSGIYLSDTADILTISGPVILKVTGQLYTASGKIVITATGSLELYFNGQLWVGSSATSGIQNETLDPKKCILVGTSSYNTSSYHYYWATYPFYGTIYMPNAYLSTWTNVKIYGAISAANIAFPQGGGELHYDTSLRTAGKIGTFIDAPYEIAEWRELTDGSDRVVLP